MFSKFHSALNLSIALTISAAFWGLFWIPLRQIESSGISASWTVIIFNAFPLILPILSKEAFGTRNKLLKETSPFVTFNDPEMVTLF